MKRKLEKPEVKIVKLQRMDVIATSGDTRFNSRGFGLESFTNHSKSAWQQNTTPLQ